MKGHLNKEGGTVAIDLDVISRYAGLTAIECFGIVGMGMISMKDGLRPAMAEKADAHSAAVRIQRRDFGCEQRKKGGKPGNIFRYIYRRVKPAHRRYGRPPCIEAAYGGCSVPGG